MAITGPSAARPASSSDLASAMSRTLSKNSRWTGRTTVNTAASGRPILLSRRSSPGTDIPISATIHSVPSGTLSRQSGKPIRLFRFPSVFAVRKRVASMAASSSFVVVLPMEPVIPASRRGVPEVRT